MKHNKDIYEHFRVSDAEVAETLLNGYEVFGTIATVEKWKRIIEDAGFRVQEGACSVKIRFYGKVDGPTNSARAARMRLAC